MAKTKHCIRSYTCNGCGARILCMKTNFNSIIVHYRKKKKNESWVSGMKIWLWCQEALSPFFLALGAALWLWFLWYSLNLHPWGCERLRSPETQRTNSGTDLTASEGFPRNVLTCQWMFAPCSLLWWVQANRWQLGALICKSSPSVPAVALCWRKNALLCWMRECFMLTFLAWPFTII